MRCPICKKNNATVHITMLPSPAEKAAGDAGPSQKHVCEACCAKLDLPFQAPIAGGKGGKGGAGINIWKLLQQSAQRAREESGLTCPDCGMTLAEFRTKGRLGCPNDYEIFRDHLDPLLERIHNATSHAGRTPGVDEEEHARRQQLSQLRSKLAEAVRAEAYENAAELRDEIQRLESEN